MKTLIIATGCLLVLTCASYREVSPASSADEVLFAEFHKGGITIGHVSDPLAVANWELRVGKNGSIEQRLFDESAGKWRTFEGPSIKESELASIVSDCDALPVSNPAGTQVVLGHFATDTTYLRIVSHSSTGTRDVLAFAPKRSSQEFARFLQVWKRIARHRPVPQSPGG